MTEGLADHFVVLTVRSDPEPMHTSGYRQAERSVVEPYADAVEATVAYRLEMQGGMSRFRLELRVAAVCERLNIGG